MHFSLFSFRFLLRLKHIDTYVTNIAASSTVIDDVTN